MTTEARSDVYYDPYDTTIDVDPYPTFRRLRDEAPLYYNEKYDFYALSRYDDVKAAEFDWRTYISGKGSVLEIIKLNVELPPGSILFEDPPAHDIHRGILARVFTPKRIADLEPEVRAFCARTLDPLVGAGGFDFVKHLGSEVPMRTIGMMLGIPEADQDAHRERVDAGMKLDENGNPVGSADESNPLGVLDGGVFGEYIDWRADNPSDDLMTELLNATYEDEAGVTQSLSRTEVLNYVGLLAAAGNETTTRLIGWAGKVLAEHPDQRAELVANPGLIPRAIEELLRYEAPSAVQARVNSRDVEHHGQTVPAGSAILVLTAAANRDERQFPEPDRFDIHRENTAHVSFGYGIHFCLGSHLARLEARVALEEVLKRFPVWDVDWDHAVQTHTSTVRGWDCLPVLTT